MKYLFRGGTVVSGRGTRRADVLVEDEKILQVGRSLRDPLARVVDVSGKLLLPGFIDAHTHFDLDVCNTTTIDDFDSGTKSAIRGGTTTIVADPHEIVNVCGAQAVQYLLDATENLPLNVYLMLPSSVPATPFETNGAENSSEFTDEVKTEKGYYLKSEIASAEELEAAAQKLNVKTVSVITTDTAIPFTTKTVKTKDELIGYSSVKTAGQNGINRKTENVEALNGEVISRAEIKTEVIKEPVEQVTLVGTAKSIATAAQRISARSKGLICPLTGGSFVISSYYGDGRGHKGMDLAADRGTGIYAAAAGTVVSSGFDGAYGYSVVIDHGNGLRTRYAHASALKVAKGAAVEQGDLLALVGSTGNSTGNHLHFETWTSSSSGSRVNPMQYF